MLALRLAALLVAAYMSTVAYLALRQRSLIYLPDTERVEPRSVGLPYMRVEPVDMPDGARILSWWAPPKPGKPVMVYFHGNGGNNSYRAPRAAFFLAHGCGVLMAEYRGYGGSTGSPTEAALMSDARMLLNRLAARGYPSQRLILFGESLGTGIAVALAAERSVAALILDSPYTSLVDVAAGQLPYLPVRLFMWDRFDSLSRIAKVHAPLLVIHGDADDVIPITMAERLFRAANEPKTFIRLKGAGHVSPLNKVSAPAITRLLRSLPDRS